MNLAIPQKSPDITEIFKQLLDEAQGFVIGVKNELLELFDKGLVFVKKRGGKRGGKGGKNTGRQKFPKNPNGKGPNGPKSRGKRGGGGS